MQTMQKTLFVSILSIFISAAAVAAPSKYYYMCTGLADIEEYTVSINLKTNVAEFFDNDTTTELTFKEVTYLKIMPPQKLIVFAGKDEGYAGTLYLYFNETRKSVALYSVELYSDARKNKSTLIGSAKCRNSKLWVR